MKDTTMTQGEGGRGEEGGGVQVPEERLCKTTETKDRKQNNFK